MEQQRSNLVIAQALAAWTSGDLAAAEELLRRAVSLCEAAGESTELPLGRLGALLLAQGRADDAHVVLAAAIGAGATTPSLWDDLLTALARRGDAPALLAAFDRHPTSPNRPRRRLGWLATHAAAACRPAQLSSAETLVRAVRDAAHEQGDAASALVASGELGQVLVDLDRLDEAIAEWTAAVEAGSSDAATIQRLALALAAAERDEEAIRVIEEGLRRGLPAATEQVLQQRLARLRERAATHGQQAREPAYVVRHGAGFATLAFQRRLTPSLRQLAVLAGTVYCQLGDPSTAAIVGFDAAAGTEQSRVHQPSYGTWHVGSDGWVLARRDPAKVGGGPSRLTFLDPRLQVVAELQLPDKVSSIAAAAGSWFVGCRDGRLYAFDRQGKARWSWATPGADEPTASPYARPCPYHVAASASHVVASNLGDLYALAHDGSLLWHLALPSHRATAARTFSPLAASHASPFDVLGIASGASDQTVRVAYRELALATHPDHHPDDRLAAEKFRAVQAAYEAILAGDTGTPRANGSVGRRPVLVSALAAAGHNIVASSSDGLLSVINHAGRIYRQHTLSRSTVLPLLNAEGILVAACSDGVLSCFDHGAIVSAAEVADAPRSLHLWGEHIVLCGHASLRVFDRTGTLAWSVDFAAPLVGMAFHDGRLLCAAGELLAFQRS